METNDYVVSRIDGESALLKPLDGGDGEVFIALALLPPGVDCGTKLRCECLQYTIIEGDNAP